MNLAFQVAKEIANELRNSPNFPYAGNKAFPYSTGNYKNHGVLAVEYGKDIAGIVLGGEAVPYAYDLEFADKTSYGNPNTHKGFVGDIIDTELVPYIVRKYNGRRV